MSSLDWSQCPAQAAPFCIRPQPPSKPPERCRLLFPSSAKTSANGIKCNAKRKRSKKAPDSKTCP